MKSFTLPDALGVPHLESYLQQVDDLLRAVYAESDILEQSIKQIPSGKRIRPALVFASAQAQGLPIEDKTIRTAAAIELVHLASLVHDDIIDDAPHRRGIPTIHTTSGLHEALLVGDFLFASACQQAALVHADVAELIAATIRTLCIGEAVELKQRGNLNRTKQMALEVMEQKTAVLTAAACKVASILAHVEQQAMHTAGQTFGLTFQLLDDVLDFVGDPNEMGKPAGGDIGEGTYTLPIVFGLESPHSQELMTELKKSHISPKAVTELLINCGALQQACGQLQVYQNILDKTHLGNFTRAYVTWVIESQVAVEYKPTMNMYLIG